MKRLGDILIESGLLTREQVDRAVVTAAANQQRLGEMLVSTRLLTELDIARALATQLGLEVVDLPTADIPNDVLTIFPKDVMEQYQIIPLRLEGDRLVVATADPTNVQTEDALRVACGCNIGLVIALSSDIKWALEEAARPKLGTILVQSGKISQQQLEHALEQAHATGQRLGEVLVAAGLLSEADIAQAVRAQSRRLGTILVGASLLTSDQVERALIIAEASRQRLGEAIVDMGLLPEAAIAHALADQLGLKVVNLRSTAIRKHVIALLPRYVAVQFGVVPVALEGDQLIVATADPTNVGVEDYLRNITNREITFVVTSPSDIAWALEEYYPGRLAAVMDELTRVGLVPPNGPSRSEPAQQQVAPSTLPRDNGPSLGQVMETAADVVTPAPPDGRTGTRILGVRLDVWLLVGAIVALLTVPCVASSLIRGRLHPLERDTRTLQDAVDAYWAHSNAASSPGSEGVSGLPTEQTAYGPGIDLLISMPMLVKAGYIQSIPASASEINGGPGGHYIWVIESTTRRVKACHHASVTDTAVLRCAEGYDGTYP